MMKSNVLRLCVCALCLLSLWFVASVAHACSIPVFRYALDRWPADAYRLEVAAGAAADPALSRLLRNLGDDSPVNLKVVAPSGLGPTESRLRFPRDEAAVWSGVLDVAAFARLTNSPVRTEIVRRLLFGESAVWVLIESGQREIDDAEAARLEKRLAFLETVAVLPRIDPTDPTSRLGPGPELRVKFSALRLATGDTRESVLRAMLTGPEGVIGGSPSGSTGDSPVPPGDPPDGTGEIPQSKNGVGLQTNIAASVFGESPALPNSRRLSEADHQPSVSGAMAAVVFGRGRVLGAWPMKDLGDESIDEACLYLLGACSCQVKQLNPGWDLLLSVDWDRELQEVAEKRIEATGQAEAPDPSAATETVTIHPEAKLDAKEAQAWRGSRGVLVGLAGAAVLLAFALLRRMNR